MADFRLQFEWEESPKVRAPELNATWARLEIHVGGECITRVESRRTQSVRAGIYVPLFPVAEWMVANWWFLWDEWRASGADPRHNLLAAREGFTLPDARFLPTETKIEVIWQPASTAAFGASGDILFLSRGSATVPKALVQAEFRRLVEAVIERLSTRHGQGSCLASEWQAVLNAEQDPDQKAFCEKAARLGCDPFDVPDDVADQIERLGVLLPEPVAEDFCDAIPLEQMTSGATAVRAFIDSAASAESHAGRWSELRNELQGPKTGIPWRDGYNEARALRSALGLTGPIRSDLNTLLIREFGPFEIRDFMFLPRIDAVSAPTRSGAPLFGFSNRLRDESRRFVLCRALSDQLASSQASLVTRSETEHQRRNRAFAAEFLAPAESLKERITGDRVGEEDIEDLADEFQVSDRIIRHQIQNHNLASLAA
jgi:hypothetical protein